MPKRRTKSQQSAKRKQRLLDRWVERQISRDVTAMRTLPIGQSSHHFKPFVKVYGTKKYQAAFRDRYHRHLDSKR